VEPPESPFCLVVMYHYVRPETALGGLPPFEAGDGVDALSVDVFEHQLDRLCAQLEPMDWPRLYAWREGRAEPPPRSFLLTFDDGLIDHARYVAPALERRGLRGVFFVPGFVLAAQRMLSTHMIHLLLVRLGANRFHDLLLAQVQETEAVTDDWLNDISWHEEAARVYHYETAQRGRLKFMLNMRLPVSVRLEVLRTMFEAHIGSPRRWAEDWYVGWEELVALEAAGHTVGGHGFAHEPYGRLSADKQRRDLMLIAQILREGLGPDVRPFSYPFGSVARETPELCRSAGFAHAFTTQERWLTEAEVPFLLPRVDTIRLGAFLDAEAVCRAY